MAVPERLNQEDLPVGIGCSQFAGEGERHTGARHFAGDAGGGGEEGEIPAAHGLDQQGQPVLLPCENRAPQGGGAHLVGK